MCAAGALIKMPAERSGTTPRNGQQHFDMLPTDPLAVSLDEGSSSSADEIGNLERRRGQGSTSSPIVTHTYIKTAWQSLLRSLTRSVRRRAATSKRGYRRSENPGQNQLPGYASYWELAWISS